MSGSRFLTSPNYADICVVEGGLWRSYLSRASIPPTVSHACACFAGAMNAQEKFPSQGSGIAGAETMVSPVEVDRILGGLESLYTVEAQQVAEAALEAVGQILSTGSIAKEHVSALMTLEELLDEGLDRIERMRKEVAGLLVRL